MTQGNINKKIHNKIDDIREKNENIYQAIREIFDEEVARGPGWNWTKTYKKCIEKYSIIGDGKDEN